MQTSQTEENLAKSINCVAQSNLIFTEENQKLLITELSRTLQTLTSKLVIIKKKKTIFVLHSKDWPFWQGFFFWFQMTNSSQNITALFAELPAESFTSGNLDDVDFMRFWFQIKMKPLLPQIPREFLSCFNTRGFSCQAYRALYVHHVPFSWYLIAVHYLIIKNLLVCTWLVNTPVLVETDFTSWLCVAKRIHKN